MKINVISCKSVFLSNFSNYGLSATLGIWRREGFIHSDGKRMQARFTQRGHAEVSFIPRERADLKDLEEYQLGNSKFQWFRIPVESEWNVKFVVR